MSLEYAPVPPPPEPPAPRRKNRHALGLAATAVVALAAGAAVGATAVHSGHPTGTTATSSSVLSTAQIANRVDPAIVNVTSTLDYGKGTAKGTGIVLTSTGAVLTNNHVIAGATSVTATDIGNGKTYKATVVGYDASHDVAVLQLSGASGLTAASTGDSSAVRIGSDVVALGNAGGLDGTPSVATGTVTALNQAITASDESSGTSEQLTGLIETNADIQPGDSGGPLVNTHGQIIGVNTAASAGYQFGPFGGAPGGGSGSGGGATQAFTIPINTALTIAKQIEAGQASSTVHIGSTAFLGVQISTQNSSGFGSGGVQIAGVLSGAPAAKAGLAAGDLVTSVAGQQVSTGKSIQTVLTKYHPGDKVAISWTDQSGKNHTATVTLANGPAA